MAASTTRVGSALQMICGSCFRPASQVRNNIGRYIFTTTDRKLGHNTCVKQVFLKRFSANATNAIQLQEEAKTQSSITNSLILPEGSKRDSIVGKVKEAMSQSIKFKNIFAVVHIGGKQFRITQNDIIMIHKVAAECGDKIKLQKVLMVGGKEFSLIGKPLLRNIHIEATVLEKTKGRNVIVFKKKRRKNYKRWKEHRQDLTVLRINRIELNPEELDL
ncbi:large ribosomal subunit protein bL21m-like [Rhopilema esculentum]|uniref:large ribosomal subunit protein bL21m-like n=1 Tax=Rhopilema esculentum TaxID=499914 RepID=UPI0031E2E7BA